MNTVFHLLSLVFCSALIYLLLRARSERDVLRDLLFGQRQAGLSRRLQVAPPLVFLRRFATALQVPMTPPQRRPAPLLAVPVRLAPGLFTDLFLHSGLSLIRCLDSPSGSTDKLVIELCTVHPVVDTGLAQRLSDALGGEIDIRLVPPPP